MFGVIKYSDYRKENLIELIGVSDNENDAIEFAKKKESEYEFYKIVLPGNFDYHEVENKIVEYVCCEVDDFNWIIQDVQENELFTIEDFAEHYKCLKLLSLNYNKNQELDNLLIEELVKISVANNYTKAFDRIITIDDSSFYAVVKTHKI